MHGQAVQFAHVHNLILFSFKTMLSLFHSTAGTRLASQKLVNKSQHYQQSNLQALQKQFRPEKNKKTKDIFRLLSKLTLPIMVAVRFSQISLSVVSKDNVQALFN